MLRLSFVFPVVLGLAFGCSSEDGGSANGGGSGGGGGGGAATGGSGNNGASSSGGSTGGSAGSSGSPAGGGAAGVAVGGSGGAGGNLVDNYFEMDMSPNAVMDAGFSVGFTDYNGNLGVGMNMTYVPGAGPSGEGAYEAEVLQAGSEGSPEWFQDGIPETFAGAGDTIYFRFAYRWTAPSAGYRMKLIQIVANAPEGERQALLMLSDGSNHHRWVGSHGGDIYNDGTNEVQTDWIDDLPSTWRWVQFGIRFNSPAGTANGASWIWVDNNDVNSPTTGVDPVDADGGLVPANVGSDYYLSFFGYHQFAAGTGARIQMTRFQFGSTFDPNWYPN